LCRIFEGCVLGHGRGGVYNLESMRKEMPAVLLAVMLATWAGLPSPMSSIRGARGTGEAQAAAKPRYYFQIRDVKGKDGTDAGTLNAAREVLHQELSGRKEFTSDVGAVADEAGLVAELERRRLQGFNVSLKLEELSQEPRPPRPGGRLKQLAVGVKLSVFGATIPEAKLAFGGDGEALVEAEVVERRLQQEAATLIREVLAQAVKLAVDQAVSKLSLPRAKPLDESRLRKARRKPR
jgi:hypothetical protein